MSQPAVSVIVPVFNTRPYLQQCLSSLMTQVLSEIEVICVDNGSTDGSYEYLSDYARRHANVTVIRHTAGRQGDARNAGMQVATGTYVAFVDSDDFVAPTMFQEMTAAIEASEADMAICNYKRYYQGRGGSDKGLPTSLLAGSKPFAILQRPTLLRNLTICNKIYPREFLEQFDIRFPEGIFHEDQFFVIKAFLLVQRIVGVPEALYFYRQQRLGSVNAYRGADHFHVFQVMRLIDEFVRENRLRGDYGFLIDELKVSRILAAAGLIGDAYQRAFFQRMQDAFRDISIQEPPQLLTPSEYREFRVVRSSNYVVYRSFLALRRFYGMLRTGAPRMRLMSGLEPGATVARRS